MSSFFMPDDTPIVKPDRGRFCAGGQRCSSSNGLINDFAAAHRPPRGSTKSAGSICFDPERALPTSKAKKTMGLGGSPNRRGWTLPGRHLSTPPAAAAHRPSSAMHKAFGELETLGWLRSPKRPRFISCPTKRRAGAPIVAALVRIGPPRTAEFFPNADDPRQPACACPAGSAIS